MFQIILFHLNAKGQLCILKVRFQKYFLKWDEIYYNHTIGVI